MQRSSAKACHERARGHATTAKHVRDEQGEHALEEGFNGPEDLRWRRNWGSGQGCGGSGAWCGLDVIWMVVVVVMCGLDLMVIVVVVVVCGLDVIQTVAVVVMCGY